VSSLRRLLSLEAEPPIDEAIECGAVPKLVELLNTHTNHMVQYESCWALTNIASGESEHTRCVVEHGAIPVFVSRLTSEHENVRDQAIWALGNIAGDSAQYRDQVLAAGALKPLLDLCTKDSALPTVRTATWCLSNLCRGNPAPEFSQFLPALPVLARLLYVRDDQVLTDACWTLNFLSAAAVPANIQSIIECSVVKRLLQLLQHNNINVKTPALRAIGNIVSGDDVQTQVCLNSGLLPRLMALLVNPKKSIRKETCWTISNITAGNPDQIEQVITHNLIPPLIAMLQHEEFLIQREAAYAIINATTGGTNEQVRFIVESGAIKPLCDLFSSPDPTLIMAALGGVERILQVGQLVVTSDPDAINPYVERVTSCSGDDALEELQMHDNTGIYLKARSILETYFGSEEADGNGNGDGEEAQQEGIIQYQEGQAPQGGFSL